MMNEKVLPETLLQLMLNVLAKADSFQYISGIQPFLMSLKGRKYYVYVKIFLLHILKIDLIRHELNYQ